MKSDSAYTIVPQGNAFAVCRQGLPLLTPQKQPLLLPVRALAEAVCAEWQAHGKYSPAMMPLTSLAYTAIDRINGQREKVIEALLVYIDTDTLSYRASGSEKLAQQEKEQWDPVLAWASKTFGAIWQVTTGLMPLEQPKDLHLAIEKYLKAMDSMRLSVACLLASAYSSLALALAVLGRHIDAEQAFALSRLEEESQAETWGRDPDADARCEKLKVEILAAAYFLDLLDNK